MSGVKRTGVIMKRALGEIMTETQDRKPLTYKDAGVDIDAGEALVETIKPLAASTKRPGCDAALGGFGGLFDLKAAGFNDPILVAANDGVGTKLKIAIETGAHHTVGIDLVAMCVNDLVVQGAEPLFFLDYYATGKLDVKAGAEIISGIADGCRQAGCALIGGETAEMPGMYQGGDYDLAGFAVGAAERGGLLDGSTVEPGDILLGLASSGVHSNGFSLIRKLLEKNSLSLFEKSAFDEEKTLGQALLTPTRIYVKSCLAAHKSGLVKSLAHITGGGLLDNIPRSLPDGCAAKIDPAAWPLPAVFAWLKENANMNPGQLVRTFNCGIGMVVCVAKSDAKAAIRLLEDHGEDVAVIGRITAQKGKAQTVMEAPAGCWGYDSAWRAVSGEDQ